MSEKVRAIFRILLGLVMFFFGVSVALVSPSIVDPFKTLTQGLGISFIVTGIITVFQEGVLAPLRKDELRQHTDRISNQTKEGFDRVFGLLRGPGIYMLSPERSGHPRYHRWLLEKCPQEIFFAGHSVLHRIQTDFESLNLLSAHDALRQKTSEGSKIRILFLDPTWSFIDQTARDEGQEPTKLRRDLATTLGICKRLWQSLADAKLAGDIEIRASAELIQYAFHHVRCRDRDENEILVGFYFARRVGMKSPLFVVENEQIQEFFIEHFNHVFERATPLLRYSRDGTRSFDHALYLKYRDSLAKHLEAKLLDELCP